jgi:mycothiol synthase
MSRLVRRAARSVVYRVGRRLPGARPEPSQLEMLWPPDADLPPVPNVPSGFRLRPYTPADEAAYMTLLDRAGMGRCPLEYWFQHLLPEGFFVVESPQPGRLAAACFASHHPAPRHPYGGNLGWLAADPEYSGRGLGRSATAAVVRRLRSAGYHRIYLTTDDSRLPALAVYLRMGWVPLLFADDMRGRWERVCARLEFPFTPERWPTA